MKHRRNVMVWADRPTYCDYTSQATCICHRGLRCPRCTAVNYTRDGAKHKAEVA